MEKKNNSERALEIPKNIQHLSFCLIPGHTKKPLTDEWQNNPMTYAQILPLLASGENNYGVASGWCNLFIFDADCAPYVKLAEENLPATFTVQSSYSYKKHFYWYIKDFPKHKNKILLIHPEFPTDKKKQGGDIRGKGFQCVGPGSIHPDTKKPYTVHDDRPIAELSFSEFQRVFGKYFDTDIIPSSVMDNIDDSTKDLSITDVMKYYGIKLEQCSDGYQFVGSHPLHGSSTGGNFRIDTKKNVWHCFRCETGGGALSLIAMMEGVVDCAKSTKGSLRGDDFNKVVEIAEEKLGIKMEDKSSKKSAHIKIANIILKDHKVIYCAGNFYEYNNGYYKMICEEEVQQWTMGLARSRFRRSLAEEVKYVIQTKKFVDVSDLNATPLLNLKNGMFDVGNSIISPHSPGFYSTIRINVSYNPAAKCDKWIKAVSEIFEGDQGKINTLQEFFGYCLTKDVKHEKALFMLGEGANGKSTILFILENLIGEENRAAVPLEMLSNPHYVINLYNKLVNISIETNAKSEVYDSTFKAIISGDTVEADQKYMPSIKFRPYCKLVYALNNMPRVNDKTLGFYRKIIILKFNRQFQGSDNNKELRFELLEELDGIFLWCLEGLKRLTERKDFNYTNEMLGHIKEYRLENNNVLVFVDEECALVPGEQISKGDLYEAFREWCIHSGNKPLNKKNFGTELRKQFPSIQEGERTGGTGGRNWAGISLVNPSILDKIRSW